MNSDCFRVLRQRLMEKLDLARELSDEEILEEIDDLLLNGTQEEAAFTQRKNSTSAGTLLFCTKTGCFAGALLTIIL